MCTWCIWEESTATHIEKYACKSSTSTVIVHMILLSRKHSLISWHFFHFSRKFCWKFVLIWIWYHCVACHKLVGNSIQSHVILHCTPKLIWCRIGMLSMRQYWIHSNNVVVSSKKLISPGAVYSITWRHQISTSKILCFGMNTNYFDEIDFFLFGFFLMFDFLFQFHSTLWQTSNASKIGLGEIFELG